MTVLGGSFPMSRLILGYPMLTGQAMRYALAAAVLPALAGEVLFSVLAAPLLPTLGPVRVSAWTCGLAVPMLLIGAAVTEEWRPPTLSEGLGLLYLALPLTVGAFLMWYTGLGRLGVARAG